MPYAQGTLLNSKLNLSKYYIMGSYKNRTCNLMIKNFVANDEGKYHCQYVENDTTISRFYKVHIQTPPDVSIKTTHLENVTYLECHATGSSGPYTSKNWEHKSVSGKHIRYIEDAKDGTLVLQKDNYQNSGIFICRVNNGIIDISGEHDQKKKVLVHYEGPPVFVLNNSKTWLGQCHGEVIVTLKVFTSSYITSELIPKLEEENDKSQSSEVIGSLMNLTCREHLVFYNVSVKVPCIEVTFNLTKSMKDDSRNYSAKVCNKFGCDFFDVIVISTELMENRQQFLWWSVTVVMVILAVTCCGLVFVVVRKREKRKQCHNIR
ncbi:uncharacterized protein LOC127718720 [Mytilus californianus]|uniref:uncharacterized protein LOC127718720 n=1 Tax=Mytilus californianus TaxID=6549 RepID=UPI0022478E48|nr:uncharacterized protein LOC127718720 [Mytilus californianus]